MTHNTVFTMHRNHAEKDKQEKDKLQENRENMKKQFIEYKWSIT